MPKEDALIPTFLEHYSNRLASGEAALFVGAGLSVGAGFVDWSNLLRSVAQEIGLDVDRETDLVAVAQYHLNEFRQRATLNRRIIEAFTADAHLTENHRIIARLPLRTIWTTNYDTLIEQAYLDAGKICQPITNSNAISNSWVRRDVALYKMHGDVADPANAVLTKDDYETYRTTRDEFITVLTSHLLTHTFLFLGFSFTDPNLDYLLAWVRAHRRENPTEHYWITKYLTPRDDSPEAQAEHQYLQRRQDLRATDLGRYGIRTIRVDDYAEITSLLAEMAQRFRRKTIFVSGSARNFAPLGPERIDLLANAIGAEIIKRGLRLVSGFGLGIGGSVLIGAVSALHLDRRARLEDRVMIRPFPRTLEGGERREAYRKLRHELLEQSGFAIFIAGNRLSSDGATDTIEDAPGVAEEFEIALSHDVIPIPIGASGSTALRLWELVRADPVRYFGPEMGPRIEADLIVLGNPGASNEELVSSVFSIIDINKMRV